MLSKIVATVVSFAAYIVLQFCMVRSVYRRGYVNGWNTAANVVRDALDGMAKREEKENENVR